MDWWRTQEHPWAFLVYVVVLLVVGVIGLLFPWWIQTIYRRLASKYPTMFKESRNVGSRRSLWHLRMAGAIALIMTIFAVWAATKGRRQPFR